jgi:hypothetical protein
MVPDLKRGDLCVLLEFICQGFDAGKLVIINGPMYICENCRHWHYNVYEDATDIVSVPRPYLRKIDDDDDERPDEKVEQWVIWKPSKEVTYG